MFSVFCVCGSVQVGTLLESVSSLNSSYPRTSYDAPEAASNSRQTPQQQQFSVNNKSMQHAQFQKETGSTASSVTQQQRQTLKRSSTTGSRGGGLYSPEDGKEIGPRDLRVCVCEMITALAPIAQSPIVAPGQSGVLSSLEALLRETDVVKRASALQVCGCMLMSGFACRS